MKLLKEGKLDPFRPLRTVLVEELFQCLENLVAASGHEPQNLGDEIEGDLQRHVQKEYAKCVIQVSVHSYVYTTSYATVTISCHLLPLTFPLYAHDTRHH